MKKLIQYSFAVPFLLLITINAGSVYAQGARRSLEQLRQDLAKIDQSIETTRLKIKDVRDARFLADLYFGLAEFYVDKSKYMYAIKTEENSKTPMSELDFTAETRPKRQAIDIYQNILDKFPTNPNRDRAYFYMAHEYRELGEFDEMVKTYTRLLKDHPKSRYWGEVHIVLGDYFLETKKDLELALETYNKVLAQPPGPFTPLARYKSGWCYINLNKFWEALMAFEKVLTEDSKIDTSTLPDIYRKTDVGREALIALVWPYSEIKRTTLQKTGEWRINPIQYIYALSKDPISFEKALSRLGRRLKIKNRLVESTRVYMEVLRLSRDLETRIDAIEQVYESMKNSLKPWPIRGFTDEVAKTILQIRHSEKLTEDEKTKDIKNFEIFIRDVATRQQKRAKQTKDKSDYQLAILDYKNYDWAYPQTRYSKAVHLNMAESQFNLRNYVEAGKLYEVLALTTRNRKRKYNFAKSTAEAYTNALKDQGKLDRLEVAQARYGLRDIANHFLKYYPTDRAVPMLRFNIGQTYFEERRFDQSVAAFKDYIRAHPNHDKIPLAANQILDALNQKEDYAGIIREGKTILANPKIANASLKNDISEIVKQAEVRSVQAKAGDFSSPEYAKKLLSFAKKNKGTSLGDSALYEAFIALKSKRDPKAYEPGEQLLEAHGNSKYAKEVVTEMGKMALLTADFRRAARYFEAFASKYSSDPQAKELIVGAAKIREMTGDYGLAAKDYRFVGDYEGIARSYFLQQNWQELQQVAPRTSGLKRYYWQGIAYVRTSNFSAARGLLKRATQENPKDAEEQEMAAHALYLLSAEALAAFEQIQMKPGQEAQAVEKKSAQLKSLTDQLKKVIAYGNGRWTIASLYGLGRANHEMTEFIQNVPLPKGLSPAVMKQVKAKLQENAAPYKKLASTYFNQCIENSEKFEVFTLFAAGCVTKGNTVVREAQENTLVSTSSNQEPQGVERLRQKLYDDSRNIKLLNELASQYVRAKDYTMAIAIYIRSLEIDPKSAETMSALGMAYLFTNNLQDAGQSFSKALKLRSRDPHALWGLVALYKEFKFNSKYKSFLAKAKAAGQPKGPLPPLVSKVL